jgi:hypothetical protein
VREVEINAPFHELLALAEARRHAAAEPETSETGAEGWAESGRLELYATPGGGNKRTAAPHRDGGSNFVLMVGDEGLEPPTPCV